MEDASSNNIKWQLNTEQVSSTYFQVNKVTRTSI